MTHDKNCLHCIAKAETERISNIYTVDELFDYIAKAAKRSSELSTEIFKQAINLLSKSEGTNDRTARP